MGLEYKRQEPETVEAPDLMATRAELQQFDGFKLAELVEANAVTYWLCLTDGDGQIVADEELKIAIDREHDLEAVEAEIGHALNDWKKGQPAGTLEIAGIDW